MANAKPETPAVPDQTMYPGSPAQPLCQGLNGQPPCAKLPHACDRLLVIIGHPEDERVVSACGGYQPKEA